MRLATKVRTLADPHARDDTNMDEDTTDIEQQHMTRRKGKYVRKRKISSDSDPDHPQKKSEVSKPDNKVTPCRKIDTTDRSDEEMEIDAIRSRKDQIYSIKEQAENAHRKIINCLAISDTELETSTRKYVLTKVAKLQGLLHEALLLNSSLEGQLTALNKENKSIRQQKGTKEKSVAVQELQNMTYAERVGIRSRTAELSNLKQDPPNVVVVRPKDNSKYGNSDETKKAIVSLISPQEENLQIKNLRRIQGSGVIIETAKKSSIDILMKNDKLKNAGLVVDTPVKKSPKVIIFGAPRKENDDETLQAIIEQNLSPQEAEKLRHQMKIAFKTGSKSNKENCNLVLETSREVRDMLIRKERLYIMWHCCQVRDFIVATRCFKCQGYGHTTKYCRSTNDICGHCAMAGHIFKDCPNRNKQASCANCQKAGKAHYHSVTDKECPAHITAINQVLARTDYGL